MNGSARVGLPARAGWEARRGEQLQRCLTLPGSRPAVSAGLAWSRHRRMPLKGVLPCAGDHGERVYRNIKPLGEAHHAQSNFPVMPVCAFQLSPQLPQVLTEGPCTLVPGLGALPAHPQ